MPEAGKRTDCVKVCFDEKTFLALGRLAAREDRKLAELVYVIVRRHLYGHATSEPMSEEVTNAD